MNTKLILIIAFLFMVVVPTTLVFALKNHQKVLKIITFIFACIYFFVLFIGTTCVLNIDSNLTTISFDFTKDWFSIDFLWFDFRLGNMLINLSMLFPLGFIVYAFSKHKPFFKTIIFAFAISLLIELYQFVLPIYRNTELTDILFNTLSGVISGVYCHILSKLKAFKKHSK